MQIILPLERVLIHRIDSYKLENAKEEDRGSICNWTISFSSFINFNFCFFGIFDSLINFSSEFLGVLKLIDESFVKKNVCDVSFR